MHSVGGTPRKTTTEENPSLKPSHAVEDCRARNTQLVLGSRNAIFLLVHPPVQSSAPCRERKHGKATVRLAGMP